MTKVLKVRDPILFWLTAVLTALGLFFIFDAGYPRSIASGGGIIPGEFRTQLILLIPAIIASMMVASVQPDKWRKWSKLLWVICFISLFLPMVPGLGIEQNGAARWFKIGPLPPIQPAEFIKVAVIIYLAGVFAKRPAWPSKIKKARNAADFMDRIAVPKLIRCLPALWVLIAVVLIEKEPDLGTAAVVAATAFVMFILGGAQKRTILVGTVLAAVGVVAMIAQEPYRMERINHHLHRWTEQNMDDIGYQTVQSELAMASGGFFGVGLGAGRAKHVIPAPTTDFVTATIGEEFGVFGMVIVLGLLSLLVLRLLVLANGIEARFGKLILIGVASWIGIQSVVNVMMANGALPAIGIPLPFISSGGSSLIALWMAMGLCHGVLAPAPDREEVRKRAPRRNWRWNRRTRVSRPRSRAAGQSGRA